MTSTTMTYVTDVSWEEAEVTPQETLYEAARVFGMIRLRVHFTYGDKKGSTLIWVGRSLMEDPSVDQLAALTERCEELAKWPLAYGGETQ